VALGNFVTWDTHATMENAQMLGPNSEKNLPGTWCELLRTLRRDETQGHLFSKPVSRKAFEQELF